MRRRRRRRHRCGVQKSASVALSTRLVYQSTDAWAKRRLRAGYECSSWRQICRRRSAPLAFCAHRSAAKALKVRPRKRRTLNAPRPSLATSSWTVPPTRPPACPLCSSLIQMHRCCTITYTPHVVSRAGLGAIACDVSLAAGLATWRALCALSVLNGGWSGSVLEIITASACRPGRTHALPCVAVAGCRCRLQAMTTRA